MQTGNIHLLIVEDNRRFREELKEWLQEFGYKNIETASSVAESLEVARAVANDPLTVPELLKELALHEDMQVRRAIASNPNTPSYVLFQLAKEFPEEFFNNPVFPLLSLENPDFYQAIPEKTLQSLLVHKSVPDTWLDWALTRMSTNLSMSLVTNPATSRAVLEKIDKYVDSMRGLVQMHVNYSGEMTSGWHEFFNDKFKSWQNQSEYAELEILLLLELGIISESQFMQLPTKVKQNILKQTNSPQLIEAVLVSKPHKILRLECARNFFTPTQELIKLAFDNDNEVRESAMCNPNIPREIVEEYYRQHMISNHPNSRSDELSELIFSKWWFIRANAAKHFNLIHLDIQSACNV